MMAGQRSCWVIILREYKDSGGPSRPCAFWFLSTPHLILQVRLPSSPPGFSHIEPPLFLRLTLLMPGLCIWSSICPSLAYPILQALNISSLGSLLFTSWAWWVHCAIGCPIEPCFSPFVAIIIDMNFQKAFIQACIYATIISRLPAMCWALFRQLGEVVIGKISKISMFMMLSSQRDNKLPN